MNLIKWYKSKILALKIGYIGLLLGIILSIISSVLVISTLSEESIYYLIVPFWPLFLFVSDVFGALINSMFNFLSNIFYIPDKFRGFDTYDLFLILIYYILSSIFYFIAFYIIGVIIEKLKNIKK